MSKDKISTQEVVESISAQLNISKRAADDFVKTLFAIIEEALLAGELVKIKGFGTFKTQWNAPRKSVNGQTGEEFVIDGYYKVNFNPEQSIKDLVNEPFAHLEAVELDNENSNEKIEADETSQPEEYDGLKIFSEQALEIKDILAEINALTGPNVILEGDAIERIEHENETEDELEEKEEENEDEMVEENDVWEEELNEDENALTKENDPINDNEINIETEIESVAQTTTTTEESVIKNDKIEEEEEEEEEEEQTVSIEEEKEKFATENEMTDTDAVVESSIILTDNNKYVENTQQEDKQTIETIEKTDEIDATSDSNSENVQTKEIDSHGIDNTSEPTVEIEIETSTIHVKISDETESAHQTEGTKTIEEENDKITHVLQNAANEIENIIDEIENSKNQDEATENDIDEAEIIVVNNEAIDIDTVSEIAEDSEQPTNSFHPTVEPINAQSQSETKNATQVEPQVNYEAEATDFSNIISASEMLKHSKKRKNLTPIAWIIIVIILIIGSFAATYIFSSAVRCWIQYEMLDDVQRGKFHKLRSTADRWVHSAQNIFDKKEKPEKIEQKQTTKTTVPNKVAIADTTATTQQADTADDLETLFAQPRVYNSYIGEEYVREGSRLTRIAERHLGHRDFWVYIYEANRETLPNPDVLPIGKLIRIPKVDSRLIDPNNPRCVEFARKLHDVYVQQ